jgi:ubiquinone/menaquinone biosynthesis C-methylase UbiE
MSIDEQKQFWDTESLQNDYCNKQLAWLSDLAVYSMIDAALDKINFKIAPKKILEIGGGSQYVSRYLCRKYPDSQVICTDYSEVRVEMFIKHYIVKPDNLIVMSGVDAKNLPFENGEFDLVVGDAMLHHIDFLKPALFEVRRCLALEGRAIFVREPIIGLLGNLAYKVFQYTGHSRSHVEINYYEYKRMLTQWQYEFMMAGFDVKTIRFYKNQNFQSVLRSIFPHLTPCYLSFVLQGIVDCQDIKGIL